MPWQRPTLKQLHERISQDFSGRLLGGRSPLARSVVGVLAKVWAGAVHMLYDVIAWIFKQVFVDTAEGEYLRRWARIFAVNPNEASAAAGKVTFSGKNGAVVPEGTLLVHQASGVMYAALEDAEVKDGQATVAVRALETGLESNLRAGDSLSFSKPIDGLISSGVVDDDGISGGVDAEDDESLRDRLLQRLKQPSRGGARADYEAWAKEVPGVTRAWCYSHGMGIGTVLLVFVTDNASTGPIPTQEMVDRVKEHIETLRPATVKELYVVPPEEMVIDFKLSVTPNTVAVKSAIEGELSDYLARVGQPGVTLYLSNINEAISLAPGEENHVLLEPSANVIVPDGYLPVMGSVEFVEE